MDAPKRKGRMIRRLFCTSCSGNWSGGVCCWGFEGINGWGVVVQRGCRAERPLFPELILSRSLAYLASGMPNGTSLFSWAYRMQKDSAHRIFYHYGNEFRAKNTGILHLPIGYGFFRERSRDG